MYLLPNLKRIKLIFLVVSVCSAIMFYPVYSQEAYVNATYPEHHFMDMSVAISPNMLFNRPGGSQLAGGINFQIFLFKFMSVESDLILAKNYLHFGPGSFVLPLWMLLYHVPGLWEFPFYLDGNSYELILFMFLFTIISAEHTAFHIPLNNHTCLSPYISFLRFRSAVPYLDIDNNKLQLSFASGIKLNRYMGRFMISPYLEYNIGYYDHLSGFNAGIYLGIYIPQKHN